MKYKRMILIILFSSNLLAHGKKHIDTEIQPSQINNKTIALQKINELYKINVKSIFMKSCFDCHSDKTVFPFYYSIPGIKQIINHDIEEAKKHIDMSPDFPFLSHESPEKDLFSIKEEIQGNKMPPLKYKLMHWKSFINEEEKKTILQWIEKGLKLLPGGLNNEKN